MDKEDNQELDINGIVLAGGKSLRLGQNKILETIGSSSLLERVVDQLSFLNSNIIIVSAIQQSFRQFDNYPRIQIVRDIYPNKGPMGGIYTGLLTSKSHHNLTVACDMPFLNHELLNYMIRLSVHFDIVIPRLVNMVEPLHAVYSKSCLTHIESLLREGSLSIREVFNKVKTRYVEVNEIDLFDPEHLSFFNINTKTDLMTARILAEKEKSYDKC